MRASSDFRLSSTEAVPVRPLRPKRPVQENGPERKKFLVWNRGSSSALSLKGYRRRIHQFFQKFEPKAAKMDPIGRRRWAIAEGYIPSQSSFSHPALVSHETACILNAGDQEAHVLITIFFVDREPVGPYRVSVPAHRTLHLRFNDLKEPAAIPHDTDYSSVFESDVPIVLQHTRLDSRCPEVSLLSTTAYAEG
jgi:hypothetical protein